MDSPAAANQPVDPVERRGFLGWLTAIAGTLAALLLGIPVVAYFLGARRRGIYQVTLGKVAEFPVGQTRLVTFDNPLRQPWDGITAETGVFVRNLGGEKFQVFANNCAHLGCPVSWFPQSGLFMCPCHGGVYYADGERASGPPPRGLYHCVWEIKGGNLVIQAPHYPTLQDTLKQA